MSSKAGDAEGLTLAKVRQVRDVLKTKLRTTYPFVTKKAPPKLSPQEDRVNKLLLRHRAATVAVLYLTAKAFLRTGSTPHRKMQQHVGVIISRLNKKRKKFVIVPGGKDAPHTYRITRRR